MRALHTGGVEDGERVVRHLPRAVRSRWGVALSHAAAVGREAAVRLSEVGKLHRPGGRRRVQALQPEDGIALALIDDVETAAVFAVTHTAGVYSKRGGSRGSGNGFRFRFRFRFAVQGRQNAHGQCEGGGVGEEERDFAVAPLARRGVAPTRGIV